LYPNLRVIFYQNNIIELKELNTYELQKRMYIIYNLEKDGRIKFKHHLLSKPPDKIEKEQKNESDEKSIFNFNHLKPIYRLSRSAFNFAIEGKDFEIKADGSVSWLF